MSKSMIHPPFRTRDYRGWVMIKNSCLLEGFRD